MARRSLLLAAVSAAPACAFKWSSTRDPAIPGFGVPYYGAETFGEDQLPVNPYVARPKFRGLGDMKPVAPLDAVDKPMLKSITRAAGKPPGANTKNINEIPYISAPDIVPKYQHPDTFPGEQQASCKDNREIKLGGREIVAKPDRLRPFGPFVYESTANYPLAAPADGGGTAGAPGAIAGPDRIPNRFARYLSQAHDDNERRRSAQAQVERFKAVDKNKDNAVNWEEFLGEVEKRQGKTPDEAKKLWELFKPGKSPVMSSQEFQRLVQSGFECNESLKGRKEVLSYLSPPCAIQLGFWGGLTLCPVGMGAHGVRVKEAGTTAGKDNVGLTGIEFACSTDAEKREEGTDKTVKSNEADEGAWSEWNECPKGSVIVGFMARNKLFEPDTDNSGLNDLGFACRNEKDETQPQVILRIDPEAEKKNGEEKDKEKNNVTQYAKAGEVATEGGWSNLSVCQPKTRICGVQTRIVKDAETDNMGITDARFYCCK